MATIPNTNPPVDPGPPPPAPPAPADPLPPKPSSGSFPVQNMGHPGELSFNLVDHAYWKWHKTNCPFSLKDRAARTNWMRQGEFPYADRLWKRDATPNMSHSGKHILQWSVIYTSNDGLRYEG